MIKKYFLDILCAILIAGVAVLAGGRRGVSPVIFSDVPAVISSERTAIKEETKKVEKGIVKDVASFDILKERNIFAADGKYATPKAVATGVQGALPENPYTLIGILQGEEKKAVFRIHTGAIVTLTVGKELIDGSVIKQIDNFSVEIEKGKEKKELKIFSIKIPKPLILKN